MLSYYLHFFRFQVCVFASDESGAIDIMLENREIQNLIGKTVFDLIDEVYLYI